MVDQASSNSCCYDGTICQKAREGKSGETLFFELTVEDLIQTPDLLHLLHEANEGVDGWGFAGSIAVACRRHGWHRR